MGYVLLGVAILSEIIATSYLKQTEGFTRLVPSIICIIAYAICHFSFAHNGGAKAVGVLSGVSQKMDLLPEADYIIASVDELQELIYRLEQEK